MRIRSLFLLALLSATALFGQQSKNNELEQTLELITKSAQANPDNPLNLNPEFLQSLSALVADPQLKNALNGYAGNIGTDPDISYRQVYWDVSTALNRNPNLMANDKFTQTAQQLNLMIDNSNLLVERLKNTPTEQQLSVFITDPSVISSLSNLTGSYEKAMAISQGVDLVAGFLEESKMAAAQKAKFEEDYNKLAALSNKLSYYEPDELLASALIDGFVGIEANHKITPMYRYDFKNGSSLRVEGGILKLINSATGLSRELIPVDRRNNGTLYLRLGFFQRASEPSVVKISPDESTIYIYHTNTAWNDSKCQTCLKKGGYTIDTTNGNIKFNFDGVLTPTYQDWIVFDENNNPEAIRHFPHIRFVSNYAFKPKEEKKGEGAIFGVTYLDKNKKFDYQQRKYKWLSDEGYRETQPYDRTIIYEKDGGRFLLHWSSIAIITDAHGLDAKSSSYFEISNKDKITNSDPMLNELTGLTMRKNGDIFFCDNKGRFGHLPASECSPEDVNMGAKIRTALGKPVLPTYDYVLDKKFVSTHGTRAKETFQGYNYMPELTFTPDGKYLIYIVKDSLILINPDNQKDIRKFGMTMQPYASNFTRENGEWVISVLGLDEYQFPVVKKFSLDKLAKLDMKRKPKTSPVATNNAGGQESQFVVSNGNGGSLAQEIKQLKDLMDQGVITQEEFNAAKAKLLGQGTGSPVSPGQPSAPGKSQSSNGNDEKGYTNWLYVQSDKALQVRYKKASEENGVAKIQVQFRINFDDDIFCKTGDCQGYLLAFGIPSLDMKVTSYRHYRFWNSFKGIYTLPELVSVQMAFNDGSMRHLDDSGFSYTRPNQSNRITMALFYNCVDAIQGKESLTKCRCAGPGAYRDLFVNSKAEDIGQPLFN